MNSHASNPAPPAAPAKLPAAPPRKLESHALAWAVLVLSLLASLGGWWIAHQHDGLQAGKRFEEEVSRIQTALVERMSVYEDVLHGGVGLFAASYSVERAEWKAYVESVSVNKRFPGIDSLGFIAAVPQTKLADFLKITRADKTPGFQVKNPGTNEDLLVTKYVEPEKEQAAALGLDVGTDPERRAVAELARDSGAAVMSGRLELRGTGPQTAAGLVIMLPVFHNGAAKATVAERRASIEGWVYARFITSQLMGGLLQDKEPLLRFQVFDRLAQGSETLIFDSAPQADLQANAPAPRFAQMNPLNVGQNLWLLRYTTTPAFNAAVPRSSEWLVAVGGVVISLLLFGIAMALSATRARAVRMADERTQALVAANAQLEKEIRDRERMERRAAIQHAVTRVLADADTLAEATPRIVRAICESLGWDLGAIWRIDPQLQRLHCVEFWHRPGMEVGDFAAATREKTFQPGEGLPGRVWATTQPAWIADVTRDKNFPRAPFAVKGGLHGAFGFPILMGEECLGVIEFFSHEIVEPDAEVLQLVASLGSQIGQFIERKRTQQDLQHEQYLFGALMESLPDRIYFKDRQSRFLRVSKALLAMHGISSSAEIEGKTDFDFFTEEHARQAFDDEQRLMGSGQPITKEEKETWPDGSVTWVLTTKMPLRDAAGVAGTFGISRDITARKRTEEALRASEARFQLMAATIEDVLYSVDGATGEFQYVSPAFERLLGYTLADVAAMGGREKFLAQVIQRGGFATQQNAFHELQSHHTTPTPARWEAWWRCKSGGLRYFEDCWIPLYTGDTLINTYGVLRDITARRQAEEALGRSETKFRTLYDTTRDAVMLLDEKGFFDCNQATLTMFGCATLKEFCANHPSDLSPPAQPDGTDSRVLAGQRIATALAQGSHHFEWVHRRADNGETFPAEVLLCALELDGKPVLQAVVRDITARKRTEEAMRRAKESAEEANRTKSQFLANMSHELRTPLNSVIGFAGILLKNKGGSLSPNELNFLERIQANGKHLLVLINEVLDLSKIEAHRVELQLAPVALDALVRETVAQQEGLVRDRPVQLLASLPDTIAPFPADADKLRQVLINLIGNALKFTERGSVTVRVVTEPQTHAPVRIEVTDTGIGIPRNKLGVIFEAFQQADASTARKFGGTGLGLTISQALCQLMGFHITVTSELGVGSTFSVVFRARTEPAVPALADAPPKPAASTASAPRNATELRGKLVLVIDDESDSRMLLTHMLEDFGCQVIAANSGEQGLRMAREFRPQIITVDLLMPRMDGATVIRALKADPELRAIPLVVVSIVAEEHRGSILGAVDMLVKPVAREDLLAALRRSLLPARPKILIVDDEEDSRKILLAHLRGEPVETRTAVNGRDGLAALADFPAELVLLDLMMPVMDGVAFLEALRTDARYQQLPVVVITSKELSPAEQEQLRLQTLEIVKKTELSEEKFKELLQRVLKNRTGGGPRSPSATA